MHQFLKFILEWNTTCFGQLASRIRMFHPDPARKLSANLYDIYHGCVYSEKLLMMDRGTVRNTQSFIPKQILEISASSWFYYKKVKIKFI